ncbi:hypothetical protein SDC9_45100 [bioreactor metagenome]|uniref:TonB C-terminal domain-containing protein n=1 Tax=bioreactor metagenome TaxID=1076179 RepID=A0A644W556_9ZZZZ
MKYLIFTIAVLTLLSNSVLCQTDTKASNGFLYKRIIEFVFNDNLQIFVAKDTIEFSGVISIDKKKIFIEGYNNTPDKTFKILETSVEEGTNRDIYICEMNKETFCIAVSQDKQYVTQIGLDDKYIYEIQTNNEENKQIQIIVYNKDTTSNKEVYVINSVEIKPIFGNASSFEEGEKQLNEYIATELDKQKNIKSGTCYISIVINTEGKVEDSKVLYGKDEEFNRAALEIVKKMPDWKPGQQRGKPVNIQYNVEVKK